MYPVYPSPRTSFANGKTLPYTMDPILHVAYLSTNTDLTTYATSCRSAILRSGPAHPPAARSRFEAAVNVCHEGAMAEAVMLFDEYYWP